MALFHGHDFENMLNRLGGLLQEITVGFVMLNETG